MKKSSQMYTAVAAICAAAFVVSGFMLLNYFGTAHTENEQFEQLRQIVTDNQTKTGIPDNHIIPTYNIADSDTITPANDDTEPSTLLHMAELYEKNPDITAWIRIDGTRIDYPVMHTTEEPQKYLRRGFDGRYAESGVPFIGGGTPLSGNTIIYGHNMKNGTMFTDLLKYERRDFWETHKTVYLETLYEHREYEVIAAFRSHAFTPDEDGFRYYRYTDFTTESEFDSFIQQVQSNTLYDTGATATYGDTFITLSTCAYHVTNGRFVIVARRTK